MELKEYQAKALAFDTKTPLFRDMARVNAALSHACIGLAGETGEVAEVLKRVITGRITHEEGRARLTEEIGDVLWYVALMSTVMHIDLGEVLEKNIDKLYARHGHPSLTAPAVRTLD